MSEYHLVLLIFLIGLLVSGWVLWQTAYLLDRLDDYPPPR